MILYFVRSGQKKRMCCKCSRDIPQGFPLYKINSKAGRFFCKSCGDKLGTFHFVTIKSWYNGLWYARVRVNR